MSRAQYDMNFVSCVIRSQTLIHDVTFTLFKAYWEQYHHSAYIKPEALTLVFRRNS